MDLFCVSGAVEAVSDGRRPRNCCRRLGSQADMGDDRKA